MAKKFFFPIETIVSIMTLGLLVILLWWKFRLGLVRYFDGDEMAYLHWAHNVYAGRIPYLDFLSYVPPGFLYVLAPLFWFVGGVSILFAARIFAFVVFVGIVSSVILLFWQVRKSWLALVAGVFLAFVPMPSDKFLEVRPDNLAMLISLVGLISHIQWLQTGRRKFAFWAGFLYSASLLVLPKAFPQVAIGVLIAIMTRQKSMKNFFIGLAAPCFLFAAWILAVVHNFREIDAIIYSLTKLPLEVNRIGGMFPMQPDLFFYPNSTYYGAGGWNIGLITNHLIWFVGLSVGAMRLVTPFVPNGRKGVWAELLIAGSFLAYIATFFYGYPLRHAQYLIPIAVFVSFYAADFVQMVYGRMGELRGLRELRVIVFLGLLWAIYTIFQTVNQPKLAFTNAGDVQTLQHAIQTIPKDAYVFDLVGSTIYYRDPYYVSGVPFGQWEQFLSRPLPSVFEALERTQTRYIYQGQLGRISSLSLRDQEYIATRYHAAAENGLLVAN